MRALRRVLCVAALMSALPLHAQIRSGPLGFRQITPLAARESLAVLKELERVVTKNPDSAAAWHRRGMVAWALAARDNYEPPIKELDWTLLGRMADTSLRKAAQIDPRRIDYRLASGRYLASSFGPVNRTAALVQFGGAMKTARRLDATNPGLLGRAALEAGRLYFRLYDTRESMSLYSGAVDALSDPGGGVPPPTVEEVASMLNGIRGAGAGFSGEQLYLKAEALFDEAARADPLSSDVFHARAQLYVARNRWNELQLISNSHVRNVPDDPWGWLALGLATQRKGVLRVPSVAFDSALLRFDSATAARLDHFERVLRVADSVKYATLSPLQRAVTERLYWLNADPMWSVLGNEPRLEFLARVAYAEFRWTYPDLNEVGADTDRGRTFIRYGPPSSISTKQWMPGPGVPMPPPPYELITVTWLYSSFRQMLEFTGVEKFHYVEPDFMTSLVEDTPVRWDNIKSMRIDSMAVQVARFRAGSDSIDIVVAQTAPADQLRTTAQVATDPMTTLWILRDGLVTVARDSVKLANGPTAMFRARVGLGNYVYRAEATAPGSPMGARATATVVTAEDHASSFAPRGFGMSDVLLAASVSPATERPQRWFDYNVMPVTGAVESAKELGLIWENYDFAADSSGSAKYTVTITLERERSQAGRIAAGIIRGIAGAVGVNQTPDKIEMSFDRAMRHAPVLLENLALTIGETPAGEYQLTVKVLDRVSNRTTTWSRPIQVSR